MKSKTIEPLEKSYQGFRLSKILPFSRSLFNALTEFEGRLLQRYLEGGNFEEMAKDLKTNPSAVNNGIMRIERKIEHMLT